MFVVPVVAPCEDDANGDLAAFGGCDAVVAAGCDTDLHTVNPAAPVGSIVSVHVSKYDDARCGH